MSLESLGVDIEELGGLLNTIVIEKMSKDLGSKYEELCTDDQKYSTRKLNEYLETKAKAATADTSNGTSKGASGGRREAPRSSTSALTVFTSKACTICDMPNHQANWCRELLRMELQERYDRAMQKRLCFRCFKPLRPGHKMASDCKCKDNPCICRRHHRLMCSEESRAQPKNPTGSRVQQENKRKTQYKGPKNREGTARQAPIDGAGAAAAVTVAAPLRVNASRQVLIKTCEAIFLPKGGRKTIVRLLIDEGADATFISRDAANRCGLDLRDREVRVSGFGSAQALRCKHNTSFTLRSMIDPAREIDIAAAIVCPGVLCEPLRPVKLNPGWTHLDDLELAEG
jgi:hypothetical protein